MPAQGAGNQTLPAAFVFSRTTGGRMSEQKRHHMREIPMIYPAPDADQVVVQAGVEYARTDEGPLTLDVYTPARRTPSVALPAIVLVAGYSDIGYETTLG